MNNRKPTPSPMEDSRELDQLIQAIYKNGHFDGRWSVKGDKRSTAKFDVWKEALLHDRRKSDIRTRIEEVNRMPNPAYIGNDGIRREPNEQYKMDRIKELTATLQQLESEE